ncbi:MAG: hypothetical protein GOU99_02700 [Candidatus Altiarchaeota archaeon]|nr:hypothetical protein [Candidatus Altiarchaeota archaeon]
MKKLVMLLVLALAAQQLFFSGYLIDDAFISLKYAENFAQGNGLVYQQGEAVYGVTSPLWSLLIGTISKISGFGVIGVVYFLRALFYLSSICLFYLLVKNTKHPLVFSALYAFDAHILHYGSSGLETPLFLSFLMLFVYIFDRDTKNERAGLLGALLGLCLMLRPESGLLFLPIIYKYRKNSVDVMFSAFLVYLPWLMYALKTYGSFIPQTFWAKTIIHKQAFSLKGLVLTLYPIGMLFYKYGAFVFSALLALKKRFEPIILFPIALAGFYVLAGVHTYRWYYVPLVFFLIYFAAQGIKNSKFSNLLLLVLVCSQLALVSREYYLTRSSIVTEHEIIEFSKSLADYPGITIATGDLLGMLGFYSQAQMLDFDGLVSPVLEYYATNNISGMFDFYSPELVIYLSSQPFPDLNRYFESSKFTDKYEPAGALKGHDLYVRQDASGLFKLPNPVCQ